MSLVLLSLVLLSLVLPSLWITPVKICISGLMYVTGVTFLMLEVYIYINIRS